MSKSGTLRVNIVGDAGPLEKTLKGTGSKIGGFAKTVGKIGAGAVVALGGAAIGAAFKTAKMGDEIAKTAPKLGISTDALQEMNYWAERNGISSDAMERAVGRLNQRIGRAIDGNDKYAKAFGDLGVELQDAEGNVRDTNDVMGDTIKALSDIEDPALQSAAASEVFGTKMARDLMPALQDGSLSMEEAAEMAHDLGIVMDEDAVKSAENFTDAWADIKDAGTAMLRDFGTPVMQFMADRLIPAIQEHVIPALQEFGQWLGPKLAEAAEWIGEFFDNVVLPALHRLGAWWEDNGPAIIGHAQALWDGIQTAFDGIVAAFQWVVGMFQSGSGETSETMQKLKDTFAVIWEAITLVVGEAVEGVVALIRWLIDVGQRIWGRWGDDLMAHAKRAWEAIQRIIGGVLDVIRGIFDVFIGIFTGDWRRAWDGVKTIFSGIWNVIAGLFDGILSGIQTALRIAMDVVRNLWSRAWEAIRAALVTAMARIALAVSNGISRVLDWFRGLPGRILSAIGNVGNLLRNAGRAIIDGFIGGVRAGFDRVRSTFSGLTDMIPDWKGPKAVDVKLLQEPAKNIMGGFSDDILKQAEMQLRPAMGDVTDMVTVGPGSMSGGGRRLTSSNEETNKLLRELLAEMRKGGDVYLDREKVGKSMVKGIQATQGGWRS